ncbi:MAG: hypothetical protein WCI26_06320 [Acidimicrobiales bacterium]
MSEMRKYLSFLLLGILTLVGLGAAALGFSQSSSGVALGPAVTNTLSAPNFSEHLVEHTPQGSQTANLVFQAPDRLGGWLESAGRRTYLYIIGSTEYISVTQSTKGPKTPLTFYKQQTTGALAVDPAHTYLPYYNKGPATTSGSVTTVTLSQGGQTENLKYTVTGDYVSNFKAVTPGGSISLDISAVGTSPQVKLPAGAKITTPPTKPGA